MNNLERQYRKKLFSYFQQYSRSVELAMRQVLSSDFAADVDYIDFVMFNYDCLGNPLPIYTWPTTIQSERCTEVDSDYECPLSKIQTEELEYYDEDIEDFVEIEWQLKDCAAIWLRNAWKEAGGEYFQLPCFFTLHDDIESYSFRSESWIENMPKMMKEG